VTLFTAVSSLPDIVARGLETGAFERFGGLIRAGVGGKVVAFLRENVDLQSLAGHVSAATSAPLLGVLNLSVASMGFAVVLKRVSQIQQRLQQTHAVLEKLDQKIDLSFYANFRAALDLAHGAFTLVRPQNRDTHAHQAIDRLAEARHYYSALTTTQLNAQGPAVDAYLATLTLACIAEARCYLELEELGVARQRLEAAAAATEPHIRTHVETLLTGNPAAFLHPALKGSVDLRRLTQVLRWLTPGLDENGAFEAQRENLARLIESPSKWVSTLPAAIWDPVFDPEEAAAVATRKSGFGMPELSFTLPSFGKVDIPGWRVRVPGLGPGSEDAVFPRLPRVMVRLEGMLEDSRRFHSYRAEVDAIHEAGVSFKEWQALGRDLPGGTHYLVAN
jgi:hypothetical protein